MSTHNIWATSCENLFMPYANNKGADQPAHLHSLISAFVVHSLDSIIPLVSIPKISSLYLASVAAQAGLSLPWSQTPKTDFLVTRLICFYGELTKIIHELSSNTLHICCTAYNSWRKQSTRVYGIQRWQWNFSRLLPSPMKKEIRTKLNWVAAQQNQQTDQPRLRSAWEST